MPTLYVLMGLPGAGKSTWAAAQQNTVHVSSDAIRKELFGSELVHIFNKSVMGIFRIRVRKALRQGNDVVADTCHMTRQQRQRTLAAAPQGTRKVLVYIDASVKQAIKGDLKRKRHVTPFVILIYKRRFQYPDVQAEGFDATIHIVRNDKIDSILRSRK